VRAGSILPLGPVRQYADQPSDEPLEIRVYPGRDGRYELYDDAGDGYGYRQGQYATVGMTWTDAVRRLEIGARKGGFAGMAQRQRFSVRCGLGAAQTVTYDGRPVSVTLKGCDGKAAPVKHR